MGKYVLTHTHGYQACPARSPETLRQFNQLISDENARGFGVSIIDRYVDDDCTTAGKSEHSAYFLVEASSQEKVLIMFKPIGVRVRPVVAWKDVQKSAGLS